MKARPCKSLTPSAPVPPPASYLDPAMRAMLAELQEAPHDYDQLLAQAIAASDNVVLGMYHFFQAASAVHLTEAKQTQAHEMIRRAKYTGQIPAGTTRQPLRLITSHGLEPNLAIFSRAAKSFGHFNFYRLARQDIFVLPRC